MSDVDFGILHSSNSHFDRARTFLSAEPSTSQRVFDVSTLLRTRMRKIGRGMIDRKMGTGIWTGDNGEHGETGGGIFDREIRGTREKPDGSQAGLSACAHR
jgi:hypothetical protein